MTRILLAILMLVVVAVPAQARRAHAPSTGLANVHYDAAPPDFRFSQGARTLSLSSLVGKPVVINFWATWCHACIDEFSAFRRMEEDYGGRVAFISLSNEPLGVAPAYLKQHGLELPLLEDPQGAVFAAYSVSVFPVTVVVSARGRVSYVSVGGLDWPELKGALEHAF